MNDGSKAIHHLNNAMEEQYRFYMIDLLSTDNEHPVEITIGTNSSETYLNEEQMRLKK